MAVERSEIKAMIDDHWRRFLTFAVQGSPQLGEECILAMDRKIEATAKSLPRPDCTYYRFMVAEERDAIFDEYTANPTALKARLGVHEPVQKPVVVHRGYQRQSVGEVAVKTAVRAGIWALIWEMFI